MNNDVNCFHVNHKKNGRDRNGNQRYKCHDCGKTWVDNRRDNRLDKSIFTYSRDMLIDWLDGHSYRTIARNYNLSPYYVHFFLNTIIRMLPDYRLLIKDHIDCKQIKYIGIDGGYINSNKGKVCYLLAIDVETNTICYYKNVAGETTTEIVKFLMDCISMFPNIRGFISDIASEYKSANTFLNDKVGIKITQYLCRVHLFLMFRGQRHGLAIALGKRKYKIHPKIAEWEQRFRNLIFNTYNEKDWNDNKNYLLECRVPDQKYLKAFMYLEKKYKQHITNNTPAFLKTNNLVESWWNLLKTKFKTARTLGEDNIDFWFNLFVLRYHFNHLDWRGDIVDKGKRFQFSNLPTFKDVVNECEPMFCELVKQHNFKRSLIFIIQK